LENCNSKKEKSSRYPLYFNSPINQKLKVKWEDGRKVLNTLNTNYSYGILEDVLNYGLDAIPLKNKEKVLVLGMGAGSVIKSLRKRYQSKAYIKAVELDPVVIKLAAKKFNIIPSSDLEIIEKDAYKFIAKSKKTYDLIIVDIFIDLEVPKEFYSSTFWKEVEKRIRIGGFVLFNAGIDLTEEEIDQFLERLPANLIYQVIYNVFESNTLIILNKID